ncbi:MAG: hypothetical protein ACE5H7_08350 [Acidiferrobacterales bacterium]
MLVATSPQSILTVAACAQERTPGELAVWVQTTKALFARSKECRNYLTSRQGLARRFTHEICPLSFLAQHLFYQRKDVVCKPNFDDEQFHAAVVDYRDRPVRVHKLVFCHATDGYQDYLRQAYWSEFGSNPKARKRSNAARRRNGPMVNHELAIAEGNDLLERGLRLIAQTAQTASARSCGSDTSLVIIFDDHSCFLLPEQLSIMAEFVEAEVLPMALRFSKLFLLGWSGRMLLGFALTDRHA